MDQTTQTNPLMIIPSVALISVALFGVSVALKQHLSFFLLLPLIYAGWVYRIHWKAVVKKLLFLNTLVAIVAVTLVLQHEYALAWLMVARANLILTFALLLFSDKDEFSVAIAMHELHFPAKLTSLLFFTAKSIFLIRHEFVRFKNTLRVRGFHPKTNLLTYQTLAGFVGILVIKAIERSYALQKAMTLRGFNGHMYSLTSTLTWGRCDTMLLVILFIALLGHQGVIL